MLSKIYIVSHYLARDKEVLRCFPDEEVVLQPLTNTKHAACTGDLTRIQSGPGIGDTELRRYEAGVPYVVRPTWIPE